MPKDIPIFISSDDLEAHNLSNGQVAVSFFEAFIEQDLTNAEMMREKVLRVGQMINLISRAIKEYEAEVQFFLDELEEKDANQLCDARFLQALNRISMMQSFLKTSVALDK